MGIAKILLVDDLKLTLEIAKSALVNSGAAIITANDGAEALSRVKKERPDLVLMDLFMPEMNGDECCKLIKEDPSISHIPIVLMSSAARLNRLDKATISLCVGTLRKPFSKSEFLEKVQEHADIKCRKNPRLPVSFDVSFKHNEKILRGRMTNLSHGGIFIESEHVVPKGAKVDIAVACKKAGLFELFGKVAWSGINSKQSGPQQSGGMGIKFLDQDAAHINAIKSLAGDLSSALEAK